KAISNSLLFPITSGLKDGKGSIFRFNLRNNYRIFARGRMCTRFFPILELMNNKKYWLLIGMLAIFALLIHLFSSGSARVESYYSMGFYPYMGIFLRYLFAWIPFSFGDIVYGAAAIWLIIGLARGIKAIFKKRPLFKGGGRQVQRSLIGLLFIYVLFNLFWGINYNRQGIAGQLGLSMEKYTVTELKMLNALLLQKVNASNIELSQKSPGEKTSREIFKQSQEAYEVVNKQYAFLNYHPASVKSSLWGWLGNYLGFMGYYNPFTGEAQVNTTIPKFLQPYTTCHEIAHQLGYAKENEANFVGYLAAASSKDASFHYSVYLDLFLYANRNLFETDSLSAKTFTKELSPAVKEDLKEWRRFSLSHKNPVEPVVRWMYGKYLENNQQPSGVLTYDEVTGFLIAYYKKYGKL
ncbi:MAG: DUF3810 domain-containing protein, partial [Ferruginibacter sp.]